MLTSIKQRIDREDEGFTLIELMVVVLIIAILLAIAIPTFLGARNSANARSAQSNLRNALTAEQSYWTNNQAFDVAGTAVQSFEPALSFTGSGSVLPGKAVVLKADTNGDGVIMTAAGKDGNCYSIEVINQPAAATTAVTAGTYYDEVKATTGSGSSTSCSSPGGADTMTTAVSQPTASSTLGTWSLAF